MFRLSVKSFLIVLALLLVPAVSFADDVYSPGPGAVCDKVGQACFDSEGISLGITKDEFGQAAADKIEKSIEEVGDDWDPTRFTMSDGVSCDTQRKMCLDSSGKLDKKMTITVFGNIAVNNKDAEGDKKITMLDAQCRLHNKKSNNNKFDGECKITEKKTDDVVEYIIKFSNGDQYNFVKQSDGYQVETPEGISKNIATMTDHGDKGVFAWGKWKLVMQPN